MNCEYHINELYTNFCTFSQCMQPLCPECIDEHVQMHQLENTQQQVNSIIIVKSGCIKKIQTAIYILQNQLEIASIHSDESKFKQNLQECMGKCKQQLYQLIDIKLDELLQKIQFKPLQNSQIIQNCTQVIEELKDLNNNLSMRNDVQVDNIQKTCRLDIKQLLDNFTKQLENQITNQSSIEIDQTKLLEFNCIVDKIFKVSAHRVQFVAPEKFEYNQQQHQQQQVVQEQQQQSLYVNKFESEQEIPINKQLFQRYDPLNINVSNYFSNKCKQPCLPFFKSNDKILSLHKLDGQLQHIKLKIDFVIPKYHKSIITQHGDIYLLGGVDPLNEKRVSTIYCYEPINRKLVKVGNMMKGRSSFGILYQSPYIYCISGLIPQLSESCERYNIQTSKSESITDCNFKSISPTIVNFNQIIYKFSVLDGQSKFEKYQDQQWRAIQFNFEFPIRQSGSGCQINQQQWIIFGGYDENNNVYDDCYLMTDQTMERTFPLSYKEGFTNPQTIAHNNLIYVLQNVEISLIQKETDESKRRFLILGNSKWD